MTMPILFRDSFRWMTGAASATATFTPKWTVQAQTWFVGTNYGRFGGVGAQTQSIASSAYVALPASNIPGIMAAISVPTITSAKRLLCYLDSSGTVLVYMVAAADGSLAVYNGSGTLLGTSTTTGLMAPGATHHIEWQAKIDNTAGTVDVWLDGVAVAGLSGITGKDTNGSSAATTCSRWMIGSDQTGQTIAGQTYADVICYDGAARTGTAGSYSHYGDKIVKYVAVTGDGTGDVGVWAQTGGTAGAPYSAVNETPQNGDTSYVADATVGDVKTFTTEVLPANYTSIVDVAVTAIWSKDDAATRTGATLVRRGGVNAVGAPVAALSSYAATQQGFPAAPDGSAWTPTNAVIEIGFTVTA